MSREKKYRLCVYLINENCNKHEDILKNSLALIQHTFKNKNIEDIVVYTKSSKPYMPIWVKLFDNVLEAKIEDLFNSSSAAVLIVKDNKRYFAFTFGLGRNLLNLDFVEESFGLRVALNSIDPDKVRSIDIKNIDTVLRHSKIQTSQAGSVDDFGMNIDRDILNGVTGKSNDEFLGKTISGSMAVYLSFPLTFDNLSLLCERLLEKYRDEKYKENFAWVDHVREIKIEGLINKLNDGLIDVIKHKNFERETLFLAIPQVVNWEQFEGFKYSESDELKEDINIEDMLPSEGEIEEKVNILWLKRKEILFIGKDEQILDSWSLYKCINYESKQEKETYLLTGGKWFKIDTDYVGSVNSEIDKVKEYNRFNFPKYEEKREDEYNKKVYDNNKTVCFLMDKKNIVYGGGQSKIEFCDLIIHKTDFVHIKRFRGSSALSHLFFQGANSARLFLSSADFRKKVNKHLPTDWHFKDPVKALDYEVVFAIISKVRKNIKDILPFFSKVSFLQIHVQLQLYGYKVSLVKINM